MDTLGRFSLQAPSLRDQLEEELDVKLPADAELHSKPNLDIEIFDRGTMLPEIRLYERQDQRTAWGLVAGPQAHL